jgi:hypothetical protein
MENIVKDILKKLSFNNELYKDKGHLADEDTMWSNDMPRQQDRFKQDHTEIKDNYLYTDENVDRYNAGKDFSQEHGQPKGVDLTSKSPLERFESSTTADNAKRVFSDNLISSFNNGEQIISDVVKQKIDRENKL